ncbi:MAG: helix-turn-helix transcriptional regulator [Bacteroidota bacterium]
MKKKPIKEFPLGKFLKELREKKGVSLKDVEKALKIPNAYLSQLETGTRKKLPEPDRLRLIADYYNVSTQEILAKAGYYEAQDVKQTYKQKIEKAFLHVIYDPQFNTGQRIKPDELTLDAKRFILEMYAYNVRKSSFFMNPQAAGRIIEKGIVKSLRWKTDNVSRDSYQSEGKTIIRYRVQVTCTESEGLVDEEKMYDEGPKQGTEKITQTVMGEGVYEEDAAGVNGYEALLLVKATEIAVRNALPKIKKTNWASIIKPSLGS